MEIPHGVALVLRGIGYLLIVFAIADVVLSYVGIDLTGVRWSPLVAGGLGLLLTRIFSGGDGE
jgi:hypothetical protein